MRMTDKNVSLKSRCLRRKQMLPEPTDTSPAVNDYQGATRSDDLDARGIAPIPDGGGPRRGERPSCTPEPNVHGRTSRPMSTCLCLAVRALRPSNIAEQSSMVGVGEAHPSKSAKQIPKDIKATWPFG